MNCVTVSHIMLICAHSTGGSGTIVLMCPPLHEELLKQLGIALHRVYQSEFTHSVFLCFKALTWLLHMVQYSSLSLCWMIQTLWLLSNHGRL